MVNLRQTQTLEQAAVGDATNESAVIRTDPLKFYPEPGAARTGNASTARGFDTMSDLCRPDVLWRCATLKTCGVPSTDAGTVAIPLSYPRGARAAPLRQRANVACMRATSETRRMRQNRRVPAGVSSARRYYTSCAATHVCACAAFRS
jgi:hypothetical protein